MQGRRSRVKEVPTDEVTVLFPWNFPITLLTTLDVSESVAMSSRASENNVLSDRLGCLELQRPQQVWAGGVRGVNGMSSVDIGSLCMFTPPVNIPASQIFCNIPSNHR